MKLNKQLCVAAMAVTLALATAHVAGADTVYATQELNGSNEVDLYEVSNGGVYYETSIPSSAQGSACHGLNKDASGTAIGKPVGQVSSESNFTIYLFTGPSCDGFVHKVGAGQVVGITNSTNTGTNVLIKSYYYRNI